MSTVGRKTRNRSNPCYPHMTFDQGVSLVNTWDAVMPPRPSVVPGLLGRLLHARNQVYWGIWESIDLISLLPLFGSLFEIIFFVLEPGTKISKNSEELSRDPWTWWPHLPKRINESLWEIPGPSLEGSKDSSAISISRSRDLLLISSDDQHLPS